ncbi:hypothetical protein MBEHAL_1459 [Halarchaeum acidiphilum MH1-52-1]|uniref:Uncharacterized protein n=1 Tax=Halarchaeum acidiphilum MH1-52-1 TaxID=1261545 RepID=U3A4X8_9EURY|nr:hypothetical protein MBEHAL_1459 [Halarchaeum acidiphilum MH1-52-1]
MPLLIGVDELLARVFSRLDETGRDVKVDAFDVCDVHVSADTPLSHQSSPDCS